MRRDSQVIALGFSQNIAHLRWSQIDRHQNEIPWNRGRHIAPCIAPETLHCLRAARLVARGPRGCSQSSRIAGVSGAVGGRINPNGRLGSRHARARLPPTRADLGGDDSWQIVWAHWCPMDPRKLIEPTGFPDAVGLTRGKLAAIA